MLKSNSEKFGFLSPFLGLTIIASLILCPIDYMLFKDDGFMGYYIAGLFLLGFIFLIIVSLIRFISERRHSVEK